LLSLWEKWEGLFKVDISPKQINPSVFICCLFIWIEIYEEYFINLIYILLNVYILNLSEIFHHPINRSLLPTLTYVTLWRWRWSSVRTTTAWRWLWALLWCATRRITGLKWNDRKEEEFIYKLLTFQISLNKKWKMERLN
jgi:hypothetical protein